MRKLATLIVGLAVVSMAFASPAAASTTTTVSMTFTEPFFPNVNSDCPVLPDGGLCGSGIVVPFGHAAETVIFGAACGGECGLRTVTLADGSIVMEERDSNGTECSRCHNEHGGPFSADLTDVIVGGTGAYAGASGTLHGAVNGTGLQAKVRLEGTITLR